MFSTSTAVVKTEETCADAVGPGWATVRVKLTSGETLCTVKAGLSWTTADLKGALQSKLEKGTKIVSFLCGGQALAYGSPLFLDGFAENIIMDVVVGTKPALHLMNPCSAQGLFDSWRSFRVCWDFRRGRSANDLEHPGIDTAPVVAREIAEKMASAAPCLLQGSLGDGRSDACFEIVVIANPGPDAKIACLWALGLLEYDPYIDQGDWPPICGRADLEVKDRAHYSECGFNGYDKNHEEDACVLAITKIMAEELTLHFQFGFSGSHFPSPCIHGGYASDGSILGILSTRVMGSPIAPRWTARICIAQQ